MAAPKPVADVNYGLVLTGELAPRSGIPHARYMVRGFLPVENPVAPAPPFGRTPLAALFFTRARPAPRPQEDVGVHLASAKVPVEDLLSALQTMHSKYKLMESSLVENRKSLKARIPGIQASLDAVRLLVARSAEGGGSGEPFSTFFQVADQVHAKAVVAPSGRVCLWLGANVMLEYTYAEALALLQANLEAAVSKEAEQLVDLEFVREQVVMVEVRALRWAPLLPQRARAPRTPPRAAHAHTRRLTHAHPPHRRLIWRGRLTTTWRCGARTKGPAGVAAAGAGEPPRRGRVIYKKRCVPSSNSCPRSPRRSQQCIHRGCERGGVRPGERGRGLAAHKGNKRGDGGHGGLQQGASCVARG